MNKDSRPSIFRITTNNLGDESSMVGDTKEEIDHRLKEDNQEAPCYICKQKAGFRILPKNDSVPLDMFLEKYGYICEYCLKQGYVDNKRYGIRPITENTNSTMILI